tara:strand:+ start:202 stop:708 length:507 start_codon:yes stop_codon:yes gene_type:complete
MTALEAIGAVSIGLVSGLMLPQYVQRGLAKVGVPSKYTNWMTSGQYTPYLAGALTTSVAAFGLYSLKFVNMETASAIAVTGVAINALNLLANKGPFAKYLPAVGMSASLSGYGGYGYLGAGHEGYHMSGHMDMVGMGGQHDDGMFGVHQGYGNSNSNMFGSSREMNFY